MTDKLITSIYEVTKNFKDPITNIKAYIGISIFTNNINVFIVLI